MLNSVLINIAYLRMCNDPNSPLCGVALPLLPLAVALLLRRASVNGSCTQSADVCALTRNAFRISSVTGKPTQTYVAFVVARVTKSGDRAQRAASRWFIDDRRHVAGTLTAFGISCTGTKATT